MASPHNSMKGTRILMWSSPVLLLVLVLTLTTSTAPSSGHSGHNAVSTRPITPSSTTSPEARPTTATTTTITTLSKAASVVTTVPPSASSFGVKSSIAKPLVSAANIVMSTGAISGQLTKQFGVADIPLQGPGTWTLTTSDVTSQSLHCGSQMTPVATRVVIGASQACQFEISASTPSSPINWQLSPTS
ncbi:MAG TPA: hypothetical protein VMV96_02595 [Acidimicrobiales bacterium]|nr:hypothetical protein [Acidimicrobiales bacterium]